MNNRYKVLGGVLLVAGTTIGAGMLALPVISGFAGFLPSIFLLILFWAYMTFTALLILEVNLSLENQNNMITMAKKTLGSFGEWTSWIAYLFLLYSLTTAYLAGSGPIITGFIFSITGIKLAAAFGIVPLFLIFSFFVFKGTSSVDYLNRFLMMALSLTYALVIVFVAPHVDLNLLKHMDSKYLLMTVAIVATSFGFHIIIPSLTTYLDRDVKLLKRSIWIGGLIPLCVYIVWEFLTLGIIPVYGENSVATGYSQGMDGAYLLSKAIGNDNIALYARFFSFFAIVTSFLGVSLSLFDCLSDSLKLKTTPLNKGLVFVITFLPPVVFALIDPRAFITALEYAGAFGVIILLGLMPALMAWSKRYHQKLPSRYTVAGGSLSLIVVIIFSLAVIVLELANQLGYINLDMRF